MTIHIVHIVGQGQIGIMSDLISRNDAIEAIDFKKVYTTAYLGYVNEGNPLKQYNKGLDDAIKAINKLSSAKPERMAKVENIEDPAGMGAYGDCSECGAEVNEQYAYCPNCGCKLEWE